MSININVSVKNYRLKNVNLIIRVTYTSPDNFEYDTIDTTWNNTKNLVFVFTF